MRVAGSVVLVTGGSSGLGAACVREFLEQEARVAILDRQPPGPSSSPGALFFQGDVTSESDVSAALDELRLKLGGLGAVVHCAGVEHAELTMGKRGLHALETFRQTIEINLLGSFNIARLGGAAIAQSKDRPEEERGVIVLTSSIAAEDGQIGQAAYSASKGGIDGMVLPLAREFARHKIRVVAVAPGVFDTPLVQRLPEAARQSLEQLIPFPSRLGKPSEFAQLVRHVVENPMLNGTTIRLDGALRMPPR